MSVASFLRGLLALLILLSHCRAQAIYHQCSRSVKEIPGVKLDMGQSTGCGECECVEFATELIIFCQPVFRPDQTYSVNFGNFLSSKAVTLCLETANTYLTNINRRLLPGNGVRLSRFIVTDSDVLHSISPDAFALHAELEYVDLSRNAIREVSVVKNALQGLRKLVYLDLSGNSLHPVNDNLSSLERLETLQLSDTGLSTSDMTEDFFPAKLLALDLGDNTFQSIEFISAQNLGSLQYLDLGLNSIASISSAALSQLGALVELYLDDNDLVDTSFNKNLFIPLTKLQILNLRDNSLNHLNRAVFEGVIDTLKDNFKAGTEVLLLSGNPFLCDCELEWLQDVNIAGLVDNAQCNRPSDFTRYQIDLFPKATFCPTPEAIAGIVAGGVAFVSLVVVAVVCLVRRKRRRKRRRSVVVSQPSGKPEMSATFCASQSDYLSPQMRRHPSSSIDNHDIVTSIPVHPYYDIVELKEMGLPLQAGVPPVSTPPRPPLPPSPMGRPCIHAHVSGVLYEEPRLHGDPPMNKW